MSVFSQNFKLVSEREDSIDAIGAAYIPPSSGTTTVVDTVTVSTNNITIQQFPVGFGSYLDGILPADLATTCGAFAVSMQQIKNISSIPIEKFAQVVTNIETIAGLPINGSSVPVDRALVTESLPLIALGSGPYGTYTMSDFFGCMSGLPYLGIDIRGLIQSLETPTLYNIYKQLYLAVTWDPASNSQFTVEYDTNPNPPLGPTTYTVTGITVSSPQGGGYCRESSLPPTITLSNGASGTAIVGTDDTDLDTFGKITGVTLVSSGTDGTSIPTVNTIPDPTTEYGSAGWSPGMNDAVQYYIDAANFEIGDVIQPAKSLLAEQMNTNWNATGTQLTIEQRALSTGLPVPVPTTDPITDLAQFPTTQIVFTDSVPQFGLNTDPHMQAQTIEAIANICLPGGQSMVGMMRQSRNQTRLTEVGIPLDDNISDTITPVQNKELIANGTVANSPTAKLAQVNCTTGDEINPDPYGFYDPNNNNYYVTNPNFGGSNLGTGSKLDTGNSEALGSFAGSPYTNIIPTNLNVIYTSKNLLPSTYSITDAIDEVIRCNCDCWDMI